MKFAYWHSLYFHSSSLFFPTIHFWEIALRTPSCFLVLITELWQMFPRLIWDGRRQPSVLRTARSHLCVQWSAKPCSDICHPSTRPRIQGMYQICQSALHPNALQPPLISKRCYNSVCDIWLLIDVRSNNDFTTLRKQPQFWDLNLSWFQAGHYCVATMLQNKKKQLKKSFFSSEKDVRNAAFTYLLITKRLFDEPYSFCCHTLLLLHWRQQSFLVLLLNEVFRWWSLPPDSL